MTNDNGVEDELASIQQTIQTFQGPPDQITQEKIDNIWLDASQSKNLLFYRRFIALFKSLTNIYPCNHLFWYGFGRACEQYQMHEEARVAYQQACFLLPYETCYQEKLAWATMNSKHYDDAIQLMTQLYKTFHTDVLISMRYAYYLSECYFYTKDYDNALSWAKKVIDTIDDKNTTPENKNKLQSIYVWSKMFLIQIFYQQGDVDFTKIYTYFKQKDIFEEPEVILCSLIMLARINRDYETALELIEKLIKKLNTYAPEWTANIFNLSEAGIKNLNEDLIYQKGFIFYQQSKYKDAIEWLKDKLFESLIDYDVKKLLGHCYLAMHEKYELPDEGIKFFENLLNDIYGKKDALSYVNLIDIYSTKDQFDKAIALFDQFMACDNKEAYPFHLYLATQSINLPQPTQIKFISCFYKTYNAVQQIKSQLYFNPENSNQLIYHYTKLPTLNALLKENGQMRMSHSSYMNDPEEGVVYQQLLNPTIKTNQIKPTIRTNQEELRESVKCSTVFLACFSLNADSLPMWGLYADDAKGCSLGISVSSFDKTDDLLHRSFQQKVNNGQPFSIDQRILSDPRRHLKLSNFISNADSNATLADLYLDQPDGFQKMLKDFSFGYETEKYCLYEVCYLDVNNYGQSVNILNDKFKIIAEQFKIIYGLQKDIDEHKTLLNDEKHLILDDEKHLILDDEKHLILDDEKHLILESIDMLLDGIKYLFKQDTYQTEKEVRLIKTELLDSEKIKKEIFDNEFDSLYIEIDKPIMFDEVILGAKVEQAHKIIPALMSSEKVKKLTRSTIKYR